MTKSKKGENIFGTESYLLGEPDYKKRGK